MAAVCTATSLFFLRSIFCPGNQLSLRLQGSVNLRGLCSLIPANYLSQRILTGAPRAAQDYVRFLSAGASLYPLEALKLAGVDMTSPQPVEDTFAVLGSMVDRLETLVAQ